MANAHTTVSHFPHQWFSLLNQLQLGDMIQSAGHGQSPNSARCLRDTIPCLHKLPGKFNIKDTYLVSDLPNVVTRTL